MKVGENIVNGSVTTYGANAFGAIAEIQDNPVTGDIENGSVVTITTSEPGWFSRFFSGWFSSWFGFSESSIEVRTSVATTDGELTNEPYLNSDGQVANESLSTDSGNVVTLDNLVQGTVRNES